MRRTLTVVLLSLTLVVVAVAEGYPDFADEEDKLDTGDGVNPPDYIEVGTDTQPSTSSEAETPTTPAHTETQNTTTGHRIVGGRQISIQEAPWQVALIVNNAITCGGSLLSILWVLTAAHCVSGVSANSLSVRAGSDYFKQGGQLRSVQYVAVHGFYNADSGNHDIAMAKVRKRFTFSSSAKPVKLPRSSLTPSSFLISGWGTISESASNPTVRLRGAKVYHVPRKTCAQDYSGQNVITDYMICASAPGKDTCQGDSGGPLVNGGVQYGVVSFGIGCARSRYPGVYTSVRRELSWIYTVVRSFRKRVAAKKSQKKKNNKNNKDL